MAGNSRSLMLLVSSVFVGFFVNLGMGQSPSPEEQTQLKTAADDVRKPIDVKASLLQLVVLAGFVGTSMVSLFTLGMAWTLVARVYFKCQQCLSFCNHKLVTAEYWMSRRHFSGDLLKRLGQAADFDTTKNMSEIQEQLESIQPDVKKSTK